MQQFIRYVVFKSATGEVTRYGVCEEDALLDQAKEDESVIAGEFCGSQYVEAGELVNMPERPSEIHTFDFSTKQWRDPRTDADLVQKAHGRIGQWRDQQEASGFIFTHADREWDGGLVVRQRMQPVLSLPGLPEGFFWTDASNNDVPMDMASLQLLAAAHEQALVVRGFQIHARQRTMKGSLEAMTRQQLLDFNPGWTDPVLIPDPAQGG